MTLRVFLLTISAAAVVLFGPGAALALPFPLANPLAPDFSLPAARTYDIGQFVDLQPPAFESTCPPSPAVVVDVMNYDFYYGPNNDMVNQTLVAMNKAVNEPIQVHVIMHAHVHHVCQRARLLLAQLQFG